VTGTVIFSDIHIIRQFIDPLKEDTAGFVSGRDKIFPVKINISIKKA